MQKNLYAFTLGREYKLSLAELGHVFGFENLMDYNEMVAIFELGESITPDIINELGGTIRITRIIGETDEKKFPTDVITHIKNQHKDGKVNFALGAYGTEFRLSDIGLRIKKTLQDGGFSARLVNTKNENINAATFKKERLGKSQTEYSLIKMPVVANSPNEKEIQKESDTCVIARSPQDDVAIQKRRGKSAQGLDRHASLATNETRYFLGITLACQDIDAYTRRDIAKTRDMVVGMMPPKLVQMMINIATHSGKLKVESGKLSKDKNDPVNLQPCKSPIAIYDPFCGLGTTLIEAANMGFTHIYGSDISLEMVKATESSLADFIKEEKVWQERIKAAGGTPKKDFSKLDWKVWQMDARKIGETPSSLGEGWGEVFVVSEGYLGEIMSPRDISLDRVKSERRKLADMYDDFFAGLASWSFGVQGEMHAIEKSHPGEKTGHMDCHVASSSQGPTLQPSKNPKLQLVMSFPFWNIHGTYSYFSEIYDIIERHGFRVVPLLPSEMQLNTMKGSLLYRRESQTVGREIVKIVKK